MKTALVGVAHAVLERTQAALLASEQSDALGADGSAAGKLEGGDGGTSSAGAGGRAAAPCQGIRSVAAVLCPAMAGHAVGKSALDAAAALVLGTVPVAVVALIGRMPECPELFDIPSGVLWCV